MEGIITAFSGTSLTVGVDLTGGGGGPYSSWNISLIGQKGVTGSTGPAPTGSTGQVVYLSSSGVAAAASSLYWDSTNSRVGVGTASPETKLLVKDGEITSNSASTSGQFRAVSGNFGTFIRNDGSDTYWLMTNSGNQYGSYNGLRPWYFNNSTGYLTMGCGVAISGGTATYNLTVTGTIGATADITAFTSDERLKDKTGYLVNALDKVCTLDTFTYTHNDLARSFGFTDNRQYVGISAQQVRKVQPEVVRMAPFDADGEKSKSGEDYMTVQYERLVPLLIEALKEERKAREALEERLERLEKLLEQK
jgi:hypothetical protein